MSTTADFRPSLPVPYCFCQTLVNELLSLTSCTTVCPGVGWETRLTKNPPSGVGLIVPVSVCAVPHTCWKTRLPFPSNSVSQGLNMPSPNDCVVP